MTARVRTSTWPLLSAATLALWLLAPSLGRLCHGLADPAAWILRSGIDNAAGVLAASLLWVLAGWLAIALLATLVAEAIGATGGTLDRISRRITPNVVRKLVIATTGASIVLSSTAPAFARPAIPPSVPASQDGQSVAARPSVQWPTDPSADPTRSPGSPPSVAPAWRSAPVLPAVSTPIPPLDPVPGRPAGSPVRVAPGDSLWLIAAHRLGPHPTDREVSVAWPYWYRTNRRLIGNDPNLLRPGEQLVPPARDGRS